MKKANESLREQTEKLNKWISEADDIRQKAEEKAKEAYDKLSVHEELSKNVKKIVEAKEKIEGVNKSVNTHLESLKQWNEKAKEVLDGALHKAQEVYDALQRDVVQKVQGVGQDSNAIKAASENLGKEVEDLGKWKNAVGNVIVKADKKCDEILKKVKTSNDGTIFTQAKELQNKGKKLLTAASEAKQKVEEKVKDALKAVKDMDSDLKKDLKEVKDKIKDGITQVIKNSGVDKLGEKVQKDLEALRERVVKLAENGRVDGLVRGQLEELTKQTEILNQKTREIKDQKLKEMDQQFKSAIKEPLDGKVKAVETAIGKLYEKFNPNDGKTSEEEKKKLQKVFEHIKKEVAVVKGKAGSGTQNNGAKGLEGIVSKVRVLAEQYHGANKFGHKVNGFVMEILKENMIVREMLQKYAKEKGLGDDYTKTDTSGNSSFYTHIADIFKENLKVEGAEAGQKAEDLYRNAQSNPTINGYITAVNEGLTTFVNAVEKRLNVDQIDNLEGSIDTLVGTIVPGIVSDVKSKGQPSQTTNSEDLKLVVKRILMKLIVIVRKVAKEVEFLGIKVFGKILDTIKPTVDELDTNLKTVTSSAPAIGTAKAVDEAIGKVKDEVNGLDGKFEEVKKPVEEAIHGLEKAVTDYDTEAKQQVKKAAETAIKAAANEISTEYDLKPGDVKNKMKNFNGAYTPIKDGLVSKLGDKVEEQLPGSIVSSDRVNMEGTHFKKYRVHFTPVGPFSHNDPTGNVPKAINSITSDGLKGLNDNGVGDILVKGNSTFDEPFKTIKRELEKITSLVNGETTDDILESGRKGLKTLFGELKEGLTTTNLGTVKGLDAIKTAIDDLRKGKMDSNTKKIEEAVKAIKSEVEELKKKFKDNVSRKDVINALTDLKDSGLTSVTWNGKSGSPVNGLKIIEDDLRKQNEELGKQTKEIGEAFDYTIKELKGMLGQVGLRLHNIIVPDDVVDNLRKLKVKMGKGQKIGLERIHESINTLQEGNFKSGPEAIENAKVAFEAELKRLQSGLQGDTNNGVIETLKDLMNAGLGSDDWVKGENKKGLQKIEKELMVQQESLAQQPGKIKSGIDQFTAELQELRKQLQDKGSGKVEEKGVIHNLQDMIKMIGKNENKGLNEIKRGIDSLRTSQVPLITKHLNTMSLNITNAAAQLGLNLNQLDTPHIDVKLKGIHDGLDNLRLTDLADAIKLCDDFLDKADEIERNTIDALLKHVDYEVDDVIKDLTKEARSMYVDSVREALELFARKVREDLEDLPGDINHDLTIGYKGFMEYLQGPLSSNLTGDERSVAELSSAFQKVFDQMEKYVAGEITRLHYEQNKDKNPCLPPTGEPYTPKLNDVYKALTALLAYLRDNDGVTDRLTELVERLTKALSNMLPSDFKHPSTPLLDTVSRGLTKFAGEFSNTYISTYSGQRCREEHAHKYAKVFLSLIPMTHQALTKLATRCAGEWKALHISKFTADDRDNALGNYLTRCGYGVSSNESGQDGELNNMFTGAGIYELLTTSIEDVDIEMMIGGEQVRNGITLVHIISLLYTLLCHYLQACHIYVPPEPRYPCTVRDMLSWISGLQYTLVADKLPGHCKALLNRRCHDGDTPNKEDPVMAKCIGELPLTIARTCSHSTSLLTAIQGNGHGFDLAAYPYSLDFSNNRAKLHYPADPAELLEMLREIACRLCKVLYFLYSQCCRSTVRVKGWRDCAYGRQVQSHHWQCNTFDIQSATTTTTTTTTTTSSSTSIHDCPPTSPLQSFLSDSCHGLLPHTLTAADMVIECANCTSNQLGQQCLTPLGFWDLGFAASISGTGWDLAKSLGDMCRDADSCLFVLCRTLNCLCPAAPSSLADVFALYAQVLRQWDTHDRVRHRGGTYTDASDFISHLNTDGIDGLFPLWTQLHGSYENHKLTTAIASLAGHDHKSHNALSSLFNDSTCKSPSGCAPYLQPLGLHAHHTYPKKHAGLYITWIMYLAWQFWELLASLLHALDNIDCTSSGCATCPSQPGTHGGKDTCHCPSIFQCAGILPTLYRYGFTYRNATLLVTANRTMHCSDLNTQLNQALHSGHFTELFHQIDQLIWHIRMPFLYCFSALWSFVALYILHTFLYRMDILRIRSHLLTTKASHRIDVKALLIPSRKMLSLYNASYFDDDPNELLNLR